MTWIALDPDDLNDVACGLDCAADDLGVLDVGLPGLAAACCAPATVAVDLAVALGVARARLSDALAWLCTGASELRTRADQIAADAGLVSAFSASWDTAAPSGAPAISAASGGGTVFGGDLLIGPPSASPPLPAGLTWMTVGGGQPLFDDIQILVPPLDPTPPATTTSYIGGPAGSLFGLSPEERALVGMDAGDARLDDLLRRATTPSGGTYTPVAGNVVAALNPTLESMYNQQLIWTQPSFSAARAEGFNGGLQEFQDEHGFSRSSATIATDGDY